MADKKDEPADDAVVDDENENGEELTAEEQKAMDEWMGSEPPENVDGEGDDDTAKGGGDDDKPDDKKEGDDTIEGGDDKPAADATDDEVKEWLAKHADKSPEELARLALDQTKRADRSGFDARKAKERVDGILTAAQELKAKRLEAIEQKRKDFDKNLADDPDKATRDLHDRLLSDEEKEAEAEAAAVQREAKQDLAIETVAGIVPNFHETHAPAIQNFGREMNYTDAELQGIEDPRDLMTLHLGRIGAAFLRAGIVDIEGNLTVKNPGPVEEDDSGADPKIPKLKTLSDTPARKQEDGPDIEGQLANLIGLDDDALADVSDAEFERLMKAAEDVG